MRAIAVDFETEYSDTLSLKVQGVVGYTQHPDFKAYMVSIYTEEGEPISYVGPVEEFDWSQLEGEDWELVAHNVSFDQPVYQSCQSKKQIPLDISPVKWSCTADMSVYLSGPRSLAESSKVFLGEEMDKSIRKKMEGLSLQDAKEQGIEKELLDYAMRDAVLCYRLWEKLSHLWPEYEQEIARVSREAGYAGTHIDQELLESNIKKLEKALWEAEQDIPWEWDEAKTPLSTKSIRLQCRDDGLWVPSSFAQDSEECARWEEEFSGKYPWINSLRRWRKSNAHLKRLYAIRNRVIEPGVMPYNVRYFGAHTGRFSGGGGYNMQNMLKETYEGVCPRHCFVPSPDKVMLISDYAQIEARVLLYLVKDEKTLEQVREGISVYEAHARATMDWDAGNLKAENPELYALAKARVLGLGYGCGKVTFQRVAKTLAGLDLTEQECEEVVRQYRSANPKVTYFWQFHNDALSRSSNKKDDTHEIELISGRDLAYFRPHWEGGNKFAQLTRGGSFIKFWGGKLTENIVQATARDIFCDAMLRLTEAGFRPLFHVHDEFVFEVDAKCQEEIKEEIEAIMTKTISWAEGLPIGVESEISDKYSK